MGIFLLDRTRTMSEVVAVASFTKDIKSDLNNTSTSAQSVKNIVTDELGKSMNKEDVIIALMMYIIPLIDPEAREENVQRIKDVLMTIVPEEYRDFVDRSINSALVLVRIINSRKNPTLELLTSEYESVVSFDNLASIAVCRIILNTILQRPEAFWNEELVSEIADVLTGAAGEYETRLIDFLNLLV